jgi:DNA-binding PadR family transcriptional regulator
MNNPFTPPENPFVGRPGPSFGPGPGPNPGFGFGRGFSPEDRRTMHEGRRQARQDFREHVREQRGDNNFGPEFGAFVPGFGPGLGLNFASIFGPGAPGNRGGRRGGSRGGGRGRRGDVRTAILTLLTERPMHGYEMIQEIAQRSQQLWKPSPGSVYPTLQLLVDEGLIVSTENGEGSGTKKLFELTADGRAVAEKIETAPWDEITDGADPGAMSLRSAIGQLMGAVAQSTHAASVDQHQRIVDVVNNARREIYQILGETD